MNSCNNDEEDNRATEGWKLPVGDVFVCFSMDIIGAQLGYDDVVEPGLLITDTLPFDLNEFWQKGLGKFIAKDVDDHSVKIVSHGQPKGTRTFGGRETNHLSERITHIRLALALLGANAGDFTVLRGGYDSDGEVQIHGATPFESGLYQFVQAEKTFCDRNALLKAVDLAKTIARVYGESSKWRRLKRTLRTYYKACIEPEPYERMHQFVRVIDGILMTRQGNGRNDFVDRGKRVCGAHYGLMLDEAYKMRNATAHLHDLPQEVTSRARANQHMLFLELIATEGLRRLLCDSYLLSTFESDASIQAFWGSSPSWVPKITVPSVQIARKETWPNR